MDRNHLINEFNFLPLRYIHSSWLKTIPAGKCIEGMRSCARTEYRLSRYLLTHFELENEYCFDFTDEVKTIALLDQNKIAKVAQYAGLVINREQIKRKIARDDVVQLKQQIGEDAYTFAIKRAPFFGATPEFPSTHASEHLPANVTVNGIQCLATLFSGNSAIFKRVFLKFPSTCTPYSKLPTSIISKDLDKVSSLLVRIQAEIENI
jgi:hypothetical protein